MTLNLDKNKGALLKGYREVLDRTSATDWALFGYDGQTYDLNLVAKGEEGLEELVDEFNSGKIQYALCKVKLEEINVTKVVLINWQGEGAPLVRKGTSANHLSTIASFFKGIHLTLNARTEEDVEPKLIKESLRKTVAAQEMHMSSSEPSPSIAPVGSTYKRTLIRDEINFSAKDEFWRKEEAEEGRRRSIQQTSLPKFSQDEVKLLRKQSQDSFDLEQRETTPPPSSTKANANGQSSSPVSKPASNYQANSLIQGSKFASAAPPSSSSGSNAAVSKMVRQRIQSFDGGASSTGSNNYSRNNNNGGVVNKVPVVKQISESASSSSAAAVSEERTSVLDRKRMFEPNGSVSGGGFSPPPTITNNNSILKNKDQVKVVKQVQVELRQPEKGQVGVTQEGVVGDPEVKVGVSEGGFSPPPTITNSSASSILKNKDQVKVVKQVQVELRQPEKGQVGVTQERVVVSPEVNVSLPPDKSPVTSSAHEEPYQESPQDNEAPPPKTTEEKPEEVVKSGRVFFQPEPEMTQVIPPPLNGNKSTPNKYQDDDEFDDSETAPPLPPLDYRDPEPNDAAGVQRSKPHAAVAAEDDRNGPKITAKMGLCATALYDYQAADDTEITFDPGELITNIERIDEGWWEGQGPSGSYGLFPANYVELIN